MTDDLDRAEQAFRTGLAERVQAYEPVGLAAPDPVRRRRWPALLAVAALVVAVVGTGLLVHAAHHDHAAPTDLPRGWRWESNRDVMVAVPGSWGYAASPDDQWCVGHSRVPRQGYVDTSLPGDFSTDVQCSSDIPPTGLFTVHLSFLNQEHPPAVPVGWQNVSRVVAGQRLDVVTDRAHEALAHRILATAHRVTVDGNGCDVSSPIQALKPIRPNPAFDVTTVRSVTSIGVCQYAFGAKGTGLVGSRTMTGRAADAELAALKAAPVGSGPNRTSNDCVPGSPWVLGDAIVLLLNSGGTTHQMYVYYTDCHDNGVDDGTQVRELTTGNCRPLFGPRVRDLMGFGRGFDRCVAPRR
jgi:hypothetical protein